MDRFILTHFIGTFPFAYVGIFQNKVVFCVFGTFNLKVLYFMFLTRFSPRLVNFSLTTLCSNPRKPSNQSCSVVLCIVCVYMCTVLLPPGVNPTAVNKYVNIDVSFSESGFWTATVLHTVFWTATVLHTVFWTATVVHTVFWTATVVHTVFWTATVLHTVFWTVTVLHTVFSPQTHLYIHHTAASLIDFANNA